MNEARFGIQVDAQQAYAELKRFEAAFNKTYANLQKKITALGLGTSNTLGSNKDTNLSLLETKQYQKAISRSTANLLKHIDATQGSTRALRSLNTVIGKLTANTGKAKWVANAQALHGNVATDPMLSKSLIALEKQKQAIAETETKLIKQEKAILDRDNARLRNQNAILKSQKVAKQGATGLGYTGYGGIYATGLSVYAGLTPIRQQMAFEREATMAVKNLNYDVVQALGGTAGAIKRVLFDMYKDPTNPVVLFGTKLEQSAQIATQYATAGIDVSLNKDGTLNEQSIKDMQKMIGLAVKTASVLEVDVNTATTLMSKSNEFFKYDYERFKKNNPNASLADFNEIIVTYLANMARKNPTTAQTIIRSAIQTGPTGTSANMSLAAQSQMTLLFTNKGFTDTVASTIVSKMTTGAFSRLADPKKGILRGNDLGMAKDIFEEKANFQGQTGDYGVFLYTLNKITENYNKGIINKEEYGKALEFISAGRLGKQRSITKGVLAEQDLTDINNITKHIADYDIGNVKMQNLSPIWQKVFTQANAEAAQVMLSTANLWERAKLSGQLVSVGLGEAMKPTTNRLLDNITKFLTGTSLDEALKQINGQGGNKNDEWGGLMGIIMGKGGADISSLAMQIALGLIGMQALAVVKKLGMGLIGGNSSILGSRLSMLPGVGILGASSRFVASGLAKGKMKVLDYLPFYMSGQSTDKRFENYKKLGPLGSRVNNYYKHQATAKSLGYGIGGGLFGLAMLHHDDIMSGGKGLLSGTDNVLGKVADTSFGAGLKAINPVDMKNMVAYYLLTSGSQPMRAAAAMYLGNKFFTGMNQSIGGKGYEEPSVVVVSRMAAIGIIMSGLGAKNPALMGFALATLAIGPATAAIEKYVSNPDNYKTDDSRRLEQIKNNIASGGKYDAVAEARIIAEKKVNNSLWGDVLNLPFMEERRKKAVEKEIQNQLNITINVDKDGKHTVSHDGGNNTGINVNSSPANFDPKRLSVF